MGKEEKFALTFREADLLTGAAQADQVVGWRAGEHGLCLRLEFLDTLGGGRIQTGIRFYTRIMSAAV